MDIINGMAVGWLTIGMLILAIVGIPRLRGEYSLDCWRACVVNPVVAVFTLYSILGFAYYLIT